jgi:hypothetical protein
LIVSNNSLLYFSNHQQPLLCQTSTSLLRAKQFLTWLTRTSFHVSFLNNGHHPASWCNTQAKANLIRNKYQYFGTSKTISKCQLDFSYRLNLVHSALNLELLKTHGDNESNPGPTNLTVDVLWPFPETPVPTQLPLSSCFCQTNQCSCQIDDHYKLDV